MCTWRLYPVVHLVAYPVVHLAALSCCTPGGFILLYIWWFYPVVHLVGLSCCTSGGFTLLYTWWLYTWWLYIRWFYPVVHRVALPRCTSPGFTTAFCGGQPLSRHRAVEFYAEVRNVPLNRNDAVDVLGNMQPL